MLHLPTARDNLSKYIDAGFPILYIYTYEEAKADRYIASVADRREVLEWNGADGFVNFETKAPFMPNQSLEATLAFLKSGKELNRKLLVIKDAAEQLKPDGQGKSDKVIALLKEIARKVRRGDIDAKVTLKNIIEDVLTNDSRIRVEKCSNYENVRESNTRQLYRKFERLLERLGGDKEVLKDGGKNIEFDELDVPIIKALISQLSLGQGIIAEFVNARNGNKPFSSNDVIKFIHALRDEAAKDDTMNKEELAYLTQFFCNIFLYSPLRSLETCHKTIDALALELHDLPCDEQSVYLGKVEHILKKEYSLRIAESAQEIVRIADSKECREHYYYERDPAIKFYYTQRDQQILKAIQEDDDLRQYIEKKLGQKSEEIFNYATLE